MPGSENYRDQPCRQKSAASASIRSPLRLPDLDHLPSIEELAKYPSVELFMTRAGQVDPQFSRPRQTPAPWLKFAITWTACPWPSAGRTWIKLLPPHNLLARLTSRLSLLKGGPVDLPPRQRTPRAAIDWG